MAEEEAPASFPCSPATFPGSPASFPGSPSTFPGSPSTFPGSPVSFPGFPSSFPDSPASFPDSPASFPDSPASLPNSQTIVPNNSPASLSNSQASIPDSDGLSECVICFTPYDTLFHLPKILTCGHVFCLECLSRITVGSTEPESLSCPICRATTPVPPKKGPPALSTDRNLLTRLNKSFSCRTPSLRFNRKRGLLYVPQNNSVSSSTVSLSVDLGRPPPDPHSPRNWCRLLRSGGCVFYGSIILIVALTIALILAGIYIFYLLPWKYTYGGSSGNMPNSTMTPINATSTPQIFG